MPDVLVEHVTDYADTTAIREFVRKALRLTADVWRCRYNDVRSRLVVIKPNWIQDAHEYKPDEWESVITHPALVLAVVEEVAVAMGGKGIICVCDAPHTYASFESILARGEVKAKLDAVSHRWPELSLEVLDLRREIWMRKEEVVVERRPNKEDPRGYVRFNLGRDSLFHGQPGEGRYYGADYDTRIVNSHHCGNTQEYLLAGTPIKCDLFINLPKMKTHKKTGLTCCLKNLVGINGDKNWLPHHREGAPSVGGDEFPDASVSKSVEGVFKRVGRYLALNVPGGTWVYRKMRNTGIKVLGDSSTVIRNGNWSGNDTCWRMALDLNRCLLHGDADGRLEKGVGAAGRYLAIVDGIVGGEGNGPLCPDPVPSNVLVSGTNPAVVDAVVGKLMGFSPDALPIIKNAFETHRWPIADCQLDEILVEDGRCGEQVALDDLEPALPQGFRPHFGWNYLRREGS